MVIRFATPAVTLDVLHAYGRPALPAMHHLRPVPAAHLAAARISAARLALRCEVAAGMLDAAEPRGFSKRKLRANRTRAAAALSLVARAERWVEDTR